MGTFGPVAETVLRERYLRRDHDGTIAESPAELLDRVASAIASAEAAFDGNVEGTATRFRDAMAELRFVPSSPVLMNAGTSMEQLAACFVLPVGDSLETIFDAIKHTALIHQSGGGTGFSFSSIRPRGDIVAGTGGIASGPVSFMRIFDVATEQIKQGGRRRGANMAVLAADHPDIESFVTAKRDEDALRNFNLSVGTDGHFWTALEAGEAIDLVNPRTGAVVGSMPADRLLNLIAELAWETGDPGMLFLDAINEDNPTPDMGRIEATNPCGELPELPYEACILGSVNLGEHTDDGQVAWEALAETVRLGIRFLDDAIDVSSFPLPEIGEIVETNRKLGLGVMGFHDMLVDLGVSYDSNRAVEIAEEVMAFIHDETWAASAELAEERGTFPHWERSVHERPVRNATATAIAPTGTISLIAGCSSGIEPIYNVAYTKRVLGGLEIVNDRFVAIAKDRGFYDESLLDDLHGRTSLRGVDAVPDDVKALFRTAHDVPPRRHVDIQAAFQRHVDNAVSKTVNLPHSASVDDVREVIRYARELGVKGITVFRSGAKSEQVLGTDPLREECIGECEYVAERSV